MRTWVVRRAPDLHPSDTHKRVCPSCLAYLRAWSAYACRRRSQRVAAHTIGAPTLWSECGAAPSPTHTPIIISNESFVSCGCDCDTLCCKSTHTSRPCRLCMLCRSTVHCAGAGRAGQLHNRLCAVRGVWRHQQLLAHTAATECTAVSFHSDATPHACPQQSVIIPPGRRVCVCLLPCVRALLRGIVVSGCLSTSNKVLLWNVSNLMLVQCCT